LNGRKIKVYVELVTKSKHMYCWDDDDDKSDLLSFVLIYCLLNVIGVVKS